MPSLKTGHDSPRWASSTVCPGTREREYALRGFDAIHLASALYADRTVGSVRLLAFDDRLMVAARNAGIALERSES